MKEFCENQYKLNNVNKTENKAEGVLVYVIEYSLYKYKGNVLETELIQFNADPNDFNNIPLYFMCKMDIFTHFKLK